MEKSERRTPSTVDDTAFAAALAHEINNPLSSLLNLLYLMEGEASFTEKGRHFLTLARDEVHRISQITHGTLNEFRGAADAEETNVSNLLRSVIDFYESRFKARGITIHPRFCSDGHLAVFPGPLRQAFSNLLLNAADAMPQGGKIHARISTSHEWHGQERHGLRVTFADNGRGIPPEDLPRIFELFFTTKGREGTGLGLSLVKRTVAKHGGALRVKTSTKPGRSGTVFAMFLPAHIGLVT